MRNKIYAALSTLLFVAACGTSAGTTNSASSAIRGCYDLPPEDAESCLADLADGERDFELPEGWDWEDPEVCDPADPAAEDCFPPDESWDRPPVEDEIADACFNEHLECIEGTEEPETCDHLLDLCFDIITPEGDFGDFERCEREADECFTTVAPEDHVVCDEALVSCFEGIDVVPPEPEHGEITELCVLEHIDCLERSGDEEEIFACVDLLDACLGFVPPCPEPPELPEDERCFEAARDCFDSGLPVEDCEALALACEEVPPAPMDECIREMEFCRDHAMTPEETEACELLCADVPPVEELCAAETERCLADHADDPEGAADCERICAGEPADPCLESELMCLEAAMTEEDFEHCATLCEGGVVLDDPAPTPPEPRDPEDPRTPDEPAPEPAR